MAINLTIRFGLLVLPVAVDAAARAERVSLKQMAPDGGPIEQKLVSKATGKEVPRSELRKAAEVTKGVLVEIPAAELAALEPPAGKAIDILEFVPEGSIDAMYFESSYYLGPKEGGAEAFTLLYHALKTKGVLGIAKAFMHGSEHIVAIRATNVGLVMHKLFYREEVRPERAYRPDASAISDFERKAQMAVNLVDMMAAPAFDPSKYHDTHTAKLKELVAAKIASVDPTARIAPAAASANLMESMIASLEALRKVNPETAKRASELAAMVYPETSGGGRAKKPRKAKTTHTVELPAPVAPPQYAATLLDEIVEAHQEVA